MMKDEFLIEYHNALMIGIFRHFSIWSIMGQMSGGKEALCGESPRESGNQI
jgi:hypothetical protein